MPLSVPVVEIDNQIWTPYTRFHIDPVPKSLQVQEQYKASRQQSSSPIFVSAKVASTSSSRLDNRSNGQHTSQIKARLNGEFHQANGNPKVAHSNGLDSLTRETANLLLKSEYSGPLRRKDKPVDEIVYPPITEPCLRSIFDDEHYGPCVWSPSHRIGKTNEVGTCQWVVGDEGFGDIERCEKVFTTTESLAKHVLFAHCQAPRPDSSLPVTCAWGSCKFKRFPVSRLKDHVIEHLRPLAYNCPFQECRMSANSIIDSVVGLDQHIQTYHINGESLRPLGTPTSIKNLFTKYTLPNLPKRIPQWIANNQQLPISTRPIGIARLTRKVIEEEEEEPVAPGAARPWDIVWLELNKLEPPAIPLNPPFLQLSSLAEPPTIRIKAVPPAEPLLEAPSAPTPSIKVEIDAPPADRITAFIDLTEEDIDIYPPVPEPRYKPTVDMTAVSLARRDAKRDYQNRLRPLQVQQDGSSGSQSETYVSAEELDVEEQQDDDDDDDIIYRSLKRIKMETA